MKVEPSSRDLLEIARATLLAEIAPALPEAQRYGVLMAANAIAIAARGLAAADDGPAELSRLAALLPGWAPPDDGHEALREGAARLAARIREGAFDDGPARESLLAHLRETVRARLATSNPRALARDEGTAP